MQSLLLYYGNGHIRAAILNLASWVAVYPGWRGSHYKELWHKAQREKLCWICATSLQNRPECLHNLLLERVTNGNDSGWSQPGPANAFSSVSAQMLLELKAKLVMARTKRICVHGRKGENGEDVLFRWVRRTSSQELKGEVEKTAIYLKWTCDAQDKTLIFDMSQNKCSVHSHLEFRFGPTSTKIHRKSKENTKKSNRSDQRRGTVFIW